MTIGSGKRDLKLHKCMRTWQNLPPSAGLHTEGLAHVLGAYESNLNRVYALAVFPAALANTTSVITEHTARAHFENADKLSSGAVSRDELKIDIAARIGRDADRRDRVIKEGGKPFQDMVQKEISFGFMAMEDFLAGGLYSGGEAWLAAQITGIWTAFESMAEALWITALNLHPRTLAELGDRKRGAEEKKVSLYLLQMHSYDLSSKMGEVLRKRYVFEKLEEMRQAYNDAFRKDGDRIISIISDRGLDALAITRHVIIHNAGIIDDEFLKRRADLPAPLVAGKGDSLPLDGEITSDLVQPVIKLGLDLIDAVDTWLNLH